MKPGTKLRIKIDNMESKRRLEDMLVNGVTNQTDLAKAFNVKQPTISRWIKEIQRNWIANDAELSHSRRGLRIRQLEKVAHLALTAFDRSTQNQTEFTVVSRLCQPCGGRGFKRDLNTNEKSECTQCAGQGKQTIETTRVRSLPGDSAFLRVAVECVKEASRMEGSHADCKIQTQTTTSVRRLIEDAEGIGGQIQTKVESLYIEAPVDLILKARSVCQELTAEMNQGSARVIEIQKKSE